jgi:hypothetical protein
MILKVIASSARIVMWCEESEDKLCDVNQFAVMWSVWCDVKGYDMNSLK